MNEETKIENTNPEDKKESTLEQTNIISAKPKKSFKKPLIIGITTAALIGGGVGGYFLLQNEPKNNNLNNKTTTTTSDIIPEISEFEPKYGYVLKVINNERLELYDNKKLVNSYTCRDTCYELVAQGDPNFQSDIFPYFVVTLHSEENILSDENEYYMFVPYDGKGDPIYYLNSSKVLYYDKESYSQELYFSIRDYETGIIGLMDYKGKIIHELNMKYAPDYKDEHNEFKTYGHNEFNTDLYDLQHDLLVAADKNGKYGITNVKGNKVYVDYQYDLIRLVSDKYFRVLENGKWYLYSLETKAKVFNNGYNYLEQATDNIFVTIDNHTVKILDKKENVLATTEIDKNRKILYYEEGACCYSDAFGFDIENNIIKIYIGDSDENEFFTYEIKN